MAVGLFIVASALLVVVGSWLQLLAAYIGMALAYGVLKAWDEAA